ncbi:hypothetical protein PALA111701_15870 [Paenibacillus lactis]
MTEVLRTAENTPHFRMNRMDEMRTVTSGQMSWHQEFF